MVKNFVNIQIEKLKRCVVNFKFVGKEIWLENDTFCLQTYRIRSNEVKEMLAIVQADSLDELCQQTIPESIRT
ncbi:MAG: hypothetical protein CM15mP59_3710 [Flavobacteriaceae bacterium]|nr:MAG: hypothetical protein CM15mP59_3710 [Flavobacteriaceae bacterium]